MVDQPLRWGILGVAKINERLLPAFAASSTSTVVAIASRDREKARAAAAAAGIPVGYGSYEELLDAADVDAVYIPLPNHMHEEWTRRAADRGKHVLCEKPLTPDADSAARLAGYCRERGVRLLDGFMWPHHPRTRAIRTFLDSGAIGRVERVDASFTFQLSLDPANIRLQPAAAGGSLLDVGCYPVYGIRWAFGEEPTRVFATARQSYGVDVAVSAILWFPGGRVASFDCGFTAPLRQRMEITCTSGVVEVPRMWLPDRDAEYFVRFGEADAERRTEPCESQIICMIDEFAAAVREGRAPVPAIDEAIKSLRVLNAIAASARENRVTDVPAA
jgi:predicted dehydrogenase